MGIATSTYDVFVSHNRRQKPWVRHVVSLLREKGLRVFFDEDSINPGEDFTLVLERAIESSGTLVLVLSRSSVFSKWVAFETAQAIYEQLDSPLHRLIPILVEPVDRTLIRPSIRRLDAVDLTDPISREAEFRHFLKSLGLPDAASAPLPPWPQPSGVEELHIATLDNVVSWNWTGEKLLEKLIALDYQLLDELTPEQEGHVSQWAPVFLDHPDTWRLLITPGNEIIGYWHFVPLFENDLQQALQGKLLDSEITTDKVRVFELPSHYSIYFVSFGLLSIYRKTKAFKLLLNSLFDVLLDLAKDGIFVKEVCANAFTDSGAALCKTFGMTYLVPHTEHGKIYITSMVDVLRLDICNEYSELATLYRNHFGLSGSNEKVRTAIP